MDNLTIHFHDCSPVNGIHPTEKELLKTIWPEDMSDERRVELLCLEVQEAVQKANAKNIDLLNVSEERAPKLFGEFCGEMWTQGYVGVLSVRVRDIPVTIHFRSRFDNEDSRFLMYVFEKAFDLNGKMYEELAVEGALEKSWDFLLMLLFVKQLHDALKGGAYKQYQEFFYNNANVKGRIDISEHIRENMLANGKVAYVTREFTMDNPVNCLILKACECLEKKYRQLFGKLIKADEVCKKGIQALKCEVEGWNLQTDKAAIKGANKKIVQSVYRNYEPLRKTSIAVLRRLGINSYKKDKGLVEGMLVDMPSLWEVFLHKQIFCKIVNCRAEYQQESYDILEGKRTLKPDFLFVENRAVFDAKYKQHWGMDLKSTKWSKAREDVFQLLSYMYVFQCVHGGIIFPVHTEKEELQPTMQCYKVGQGQPDADFWLIPIAVSKEENAVAFREAMDRQLDILRQSIKIKMLSYKEELELRPIS